MTRLFVLSLAAVILMTASSRADADGRVYTINNDTQENGVAVWQQNADGTLTEIKGSPFATGGKGLAGGNINEQGAIRVHDGFVLAVNPGSDTIAVLRQVQDGQLEPVAGSPFASGGSAPLSLTAHGDLVYVANQAPDFAQPKEPPCIMGFRMSKDGKLAPIANSRRTFKQGLGPAQVEFSPDGRMVAMTSGFQKEPSSAIHCAMVQDDGVLKLQDTSTVRPTGASGVVGFSWSPQGDWLYVSNFRGSAIAVFAVDEASGNLKQAGSPYSSKDEAACWTAISRDGKTLYVANYAGNSISTFDVQADGQLKLLGVTERRANSKPDTKDITLSADSKFLYALGSSAKEISLFRIGKDRLPMELPKEQSPARITQGQNALGLAVD